MADVDLGTQAVRNVVESFLPYSFTQVNQMVHKFRIAERRHVYTTPKSFLELLKLFSMLLGSKRKDANNSIDRLAHGLTKLRETAAAVTQIEADLKISLEEADQKRAVAEGIAEVRTVAIHCIPYRLQVRELTEGAGLLSQHAPKHVCVCMCACARSFRIMTIFVHVTCPAFF
jgi:hypothetical protein